tara:strand:+ start:416 stop:619 length:204 start_codon:yes stop_codon:yes gene_type:complete
MNRKMKAIAVATQKGGSGTISIHLAVQAMQSKKNAQVILFMRDEGGKMHATTAMTKDQLKALHEHNH